MHTTTTRFTRTIVTALVAGAALAPAAAAQQQDLRLPDTRDAAKRTQPRQDLRLPDTQDAAAGRTAPVVEIVRVDRPDGFDWTDATVGAAGGLGLALMGAGGAIVAVRLRRRTFRPVSADA